MLFFFPHQISFISKRRGEASVWIWSVSSQQKYSTGWYTKILFLIKIFHLLSVSVEAMCICWLVMLFSTENSCEQLGGVLQITSFTCLIALCWDFLLPCLEKGLWANNDFFSFSSSKYCEHTCPVWKMVNVFCYFHHTQFISLLCCLILLYY